MINAGDVLDCPRQAFRISQAPAYHLHLISGQMAQVRRRARQIPLQLLPRMLLGVIRLVLGAGISPCPPSLAYFAKIRPRTAQ